MFDIQIPLMVQYYRKAVEVVPTGKKMSIRVGHTTVNVYKDLAKLLKEDPARLEEAATLFLKAISLEHPDSRLSVWYMEAGDCYLRLGDYERAQENFLLALKAEPDSAETNYNLAVAYHKVDKVKLAEKHLRSAVSLNGQYPPALLALGTILSTSDHSKTQDEALML